MYGTAGPHRFDCSGFTRYVWGRLGKSLPHSSAQQYSSSAVRHVAKSERTAGDLIFMKNSSGRITHVGIYVGGQRFVHAPNTGGTVRLDRLDAPYWSSRFVYGKRVLGAL